MTSDNRLSGRSSARCGRRADPKDRSVQGAVGNRCSGTQVLARAGAWWRDVRLMTWCLVRLRGHPSCLSDGQGVHLLVVIGQRAGERDHVLVQLGPW